jgi:hypothetical protein
MPNALTLAAALLLLSPCVPVARADGPPDAEERIRRLEEALRAQAEATDRLAREFDAYRRENPSAARSTEQEIGRSIDAYLASLPSTSLPVAGPARPGVEWGGYLTLEYLDESAQNSRFDLHRLVLDASASIADRIDFRAEIEIEHGGVSDEIDGEIVVERAEVRFHVCDALVPKVGWLLVPFGRYNLQHDDPMNDFTLRPFTARYLVPTGFGQPGAGAEGSVPVGRHVLSYDVALTNGYKDDFTATAGVRDARQARDQNDGKQVWGRVAVAWDAGRALDAIETGVSGTWGIYDDEDDDAISGLGLDFLVRMGPFEAKGEYVVYDIGRGAGDPPGAVRGQAGLWLEAAWHFFPSFWRCARNALVTDTSLFTVAARYQWMDLDDSQDGASWEDDIEALSIGLNYRITERSVFRIDHTWYDAEGGDDRTQWAASFSTYF